MFMIDLPDIMLELNCLIIILMTSFCISISFVLMKTKSSS